MGFLKLLKSIGRTWKLSLSIALSVMLVWEGFAIAASPKGMQADIDVVRDFLKTTGLSQKEVTLKEFYNKAGHAYPESYRKELKQLADKYPNMKFPKITVNKVKGASGEDEAQLIYNYEGKSYVMNLQSGGDVFLKMGDMKVTHNDMHKFDKKASAKLAKYFLKDEKAVSRGLASLNSPANVGKLNLLSLKQFNALPKTEQVEYMNWLKSFMVTAENLQNSRFGKNAKKVSGTFEQAYPYAAFALNEVLGEDAFAVEPGMSASMNAPSGPCITAGWIGQWTPGDSPKCVALGAKNDPSCGATGLSCNSSIFGKNKSGSAYCVTENLNHATAQCAALSGDDCDPSTYGLLKQNIEKYWNGQVAPICSQVADYSAGSMDAVDGDDVNASFRTENPYQYSACKALNDWRSHVDARKVCDGSAGGGTGDTGGGAIGGGGNNGQHNCNQNNGGAVGGGVDNGSNGGGAIGGGVTSPGKVNPDCPCAHVDEPPVAAQDLICATGSETKNIFNCSEYAEEVCAPKIVDVHGKNSRIIKKRFACISCKDGFDLTDGKCVKIAGTSGDSKSGGGFFGWIGGMFSKVGSWFKSAFKSPYMPIFLAGAVGLGVWAWSERHYAKKYYKYITPDESEDPAEAPTTPEDIIRGFQ